MYSLPLVVIQLIVTYYTVCLPSSFPVLPRASNIFLLSSLFFLSHSHFQLSLFCSPILARSLHSRSSSHAETHKLLEYLHDATSGFFDSYSDFKDSNRTTLLVIRIIMSTVNALPLLLYSYPFLLFFLSFFKFLLGSFYYAPFHSRSLPLCRVMNNF